MILCSTCGKTMAENRAKCYECGAVVNRLIREPKSSIKMENASGSKSSSYSKPTPSSSRACPVTEYEIRAFLSQRAPVTTQDFVAKCKARLKSLEMQDKIAFVQILRRIIKIQKINNSSYVVLKDRSTGKHLSRL